MAIDVSEMSVQQRLERIDAEISGVISLSNTKYEDRQFMSSLKERGVTHLSDKQDKWLSDIEDRVFQEEDDGPG